MTTTTTLDSPEHAPWTGERGEFRPPRFESPFRRQPDGSLYPTAGRVVRRWVEKCLVHGEGDVIGEPVTLTRAERYILDRALEFDPLTGRLLYDTVLIGMAKGNSKTEQAARFGLADLLGPVRAVSPRVIIAAGSFDQADELFTASTLALTGTIDSPAPYAQHFHPGNDLLEDRILLPDGHGELRRIASIGGISDGGKPSLFLGDELHEWTTAKQERVWIVQSKSLRKRRVIRHTPPELGLPPGVRLNGALMVGITTQGVSPDSLLGRLYDHGLEVAAGKTGPASDRFLFMWWEADERWDLSDPEQLTQAILEANPNASTDEDAWLPVENIAASINDPLVPRNEGIRYNLNRYVSAAEALVPAEAWAAAATSSTRPLDYRPDLPVVAAVHISHDRRSAAVAVAQRIQTDDDDGHYLIAATDYPKQPLPEGETLEVSDLEEHIAGLRAQYPALVHTVIRVSPTRPGRTVLVPGPLVVYHGAFFEGSAQRLRRDRMATETTPATRDKLAEAVEAMKGLVHDGRLTHDGGAALTRAVANLDGEPTARGWYPVARHPRIAIDPALAAAVALHRAMTLPPPIRIMDDAGVAAGF